MTCSIEGCENPVRTKKSGLCNAHYVKQRKYGDPLGGRKAKVECAPAAVSEPASEPAAWDTP